MRFIGLKSCDTCRKALKELRAAGFEPDVVDIRADGLSEADISAIVAHCPEKAVNRASTTWRGLSEVERAADPADLLAAHPTLLKRPAIHSDGVWTVGWTPAVRSQRLGEG